MQKKIFISQTYFVGNIWKAKKLLYLKSKQDIIHIKRRIFSEKLCVNTVIMKKVEKFFGNTYLNKNQCTK